MLPSICRSLLASQLWSNFRLIPALYGNIPAFTQNNFVFLPPKVSYFHRYGVRARCANEKVGERSHKWQYFFRGYAQEIILARDLLCQPRAWCWIPVRIQFLLGTGNSSSTDHSWVWPHDHNFYSTVNPALHMQNWFIHFCCHESTQICEYNQGLTP